MKRRFPREVRAPLAAPMLSVSSLRHACSRQPRVTQHLDLTSPVNEERSGARNHSTTSKLAPSSSATARDPYRPIAQARPIW